jgi:hypothetical protein
VREHQGDGEAGFEFLESHKKSLINRFRSNLILSVHRYKPRQTFY